MAAVADAPRVEPAPIWPGLTQMAELQKMLWAAERPIAILGGPRLDRAGERRLRPLRRALRPAGRRLVPARRAPSTASTTIIAGEIGLSVNPKLKARIEAADLVLLVGGRMSEAAAQGYTLFGIPAPRQRLVHVHADAARDRPQLSSDARDRRDDAGVLRRARRRCSRRRRFRWSAETRQARADYLAWSEQAPRQSRPGAVERDHVRAPAARPRRDLRHRRRQFLDLGRPLPALSRGSSSRLGRRRDRWVSACRRRSARRGSSRADGRLLRRRRRLPDERAGIRDRRSVRAADRRRR